MQFGDKSRYNNTEQYQLMDRRKRLVNVVAVPDPVYPLIAGIHLWRQGQRPDHLAAQYLGYNAGFWRIADANNAMLPETLSEQSEIAIPSKY
jgi:hypothetical protein